MKTHYYREDIIKICDKKHLTVEEIFEELSKIHNDAGKSTIYRNVEDMVETGDLRKVVGVGKKAYFEANCGNHIHLVDINTGEIIDFNEEIILSNLPENFKVKNMDVKLFGEFSSK
ncbi:MAG: transcriptional repressor [Candidatus Gracilibacteria bacterium]|nr:transcriptional repressor [Candidatus Gracilibacteria bacterium]